MIHEGAALVSCYTHLSTPRIGGKDRAAVALLGGEHTMLLTPWPRNPKV